MSFFSDLAPQGITKSNFTKNAPIGSSIAVAQGPLPKQMVEGLGLDTFQQKADKEMRLKVLMNGTK
jgi:hypothetical protein